MGFLEVLQGWQQQYGSTLWSLVSLWNRDAELEGAELTERKAM